MAMHRLVAHAALWALLLSIAPTALGASAGPFNGTWFTNDFDGSKMSLQFGGNGSARQVTLTDWRATYCAGGKWQAQGTGAVAGNVATLAGTGIGVCLNGYASPLDINATWTYDSGGNTLTDQDGLVWQRSAVTDAFSGNWYSIDPFDDSAQKLTIAGSSLTRRVTYIDYLATSCDPDAVFVAQGDGVIGSTPGMGRFMDVDFAGACRGQPPIDFAVQFEYLVATNELTDNAGTFWHR